MLNHMRKKHGLLTGPQLEVLRLRLTGMTQVEIAGRLKTTRQNISIIERRGRRNLRLAEETIREFKKLNLATSVKLKHGIHMVDIPRFIVDAADKANVKLKADFTRIYNEIRFKASECVKGTKVIKPIMVLILENGDIDIIPKESGKSRHRSGDGYF
jgi:Tfx family DNA-binding protein